MKNVYMCDFCSYINTKENVKEHEKCCLKNPNVKNCFNCCYACEMPSMTRTWGWGGKDAESNFYCTYVMEKDDANFCVKKIINPEHICEHYKRGASSTTIYT